MKRRRLQGLGSRLRSLLSDQGGNALALVSLSMVALLGMTGLVVDGGMLMATRAEMQKAANAAALSAAQELTNSETAVTSVAETVLEEHQALESMDELTIAMKDRVTVGLAKDMPLGFARLFGMDAVPISVSATAELGVMGEATGVAPLGIRDDIDLTYYQEYQLKVDAGDSDTGYFGILALGGMGADTYGYNLMYGYRNPIEIGDILPTKTGNVAGKTRDGVDYRIAACPYPEGETQHRDCPRVILIPVYKEYSYSGQQLDQVEVTGFAYFYILGRMRNNDDSIRGMFIERAGTGFVNEGAADRGAYAIRLTE